MYRETTPVLMPAGIETVQRKPFAPQQRQNGSRVFRGKVTIFSTSFAENPIEWKQIVIAASGGIFLLIIFLCLVWLKLKRQNNEEYERQHLIDEERNVEHNNLDDGRRTENLFQPLMSVSSCSRSDNMESATKIKNKDIFKVGSVPV